MGQRTSIGNVGKRLKAVERHLLKISSQNQQVNERSIKSDKPINACFRNPSFSATC